MSLVFYCRRTRRRAASRRKHTCTSTRLGSVAWNRITILWMHLREYTVMQRSTQRYGLLLLTSYLLSNHTENRPVGRHYIALCIHWYCRQHQLHTKLQYSKCFRVVITRLHVD